MACLKPLDAWYYYDPETRSRQISFGRRPNYDTSKGLLLPCGRCVGCRLDRSQAWAVRLMHEASLHEKSSFLTLTYDEDHVPFDGSLDVEEFKRFMKRLRKVCGPLKYFHCGEYGEKYSRPHYHCILFGEDFAHDRVLAGKTQSGFDQFQSEKLDRTWQLGRAVISEVTFESCAYVARYTLKKVHSTKAQPTRKEDHYRGRKPEYATQSNGIGKGWLEKWGFSNVYDFDQVIMRERPVSVPKYYDKLLEKADPEKFDEVKTARTRTAEALKWSPELRSGRLLARNRVKEATVRQALKRKQE